MTNFARPTHELPSLPPLVRREWFSFNHIQLFLAWFLVPRSSASAQYSVARPVAVALFRRGSPFGLSFLTPHEVAGARCPLVFLSLRLCCQEFQFSKDEPLYLR